MKDLSAISSFSAVRSLIGSMPGPDEQALAKWQEREPQLTKPAGSLGRLEEISRFLSAWQGRHPPRLDKVRARVFAGSHGVMALGVSAFPAEVNFQMVANFQAGGAAINQLCKTFGIELAVETLELDRPTADFTKGPAMSEEECLTALRCGMAVAEPGVDLLVIGEMGIGNTTSAAAICHGLFGGVAADWTGRGTGVDDEHLKIKIDVVERGVAANRSDDPLTVLRSVGGRELAAMTGAILAARHRRIPVLLDGYVCTAAAAVLHAADPRALDHCLVGHTSVEPGHRRLLEKIGQRALLDMDMRLGEASGAALAVGLARAAVACHTGMATFAEAGVSDKH
ncbi:nicotinate-nucleotide--dimethylbenzimidazole phosphoribosyltransferase [Telmatospirillum sp.]|uniref:nicotinate-nucleotide--dimethylbenzimidazole phosphoribosyltransferase n=1 Tax=Telmatospirillum sp. TaxID=2079197 RepID=UPI00283F4180|nr:nicotinate-nucleotide--dimethylbenzimidazole phosphoribosyltransferase [Telmatospirillum sp.]MDR3437171.1 nicotinate-nucleotide--dimethylbenzimidazole phosphoribosyltransferase [Telmatospirillum sp.]